MVKPNYLFNCIQYYREKDLDEVLQTTAVFANVSKGVLAKREDLMLVFGTDDEELICKKILSEGELQVSDKERKVELDTLFRDVASILSEKCLNPENNRPYTISMLERALKDVHFSVDPKRPAKTQALEALPILKSRFPIERARMRLRITMPLTGGDDLKELLNSRAAAIEEQDLHGNMLTLVCLLDPGAYRAVHALVQGAGAGGRVEVVALAAIAAETDATADIESLSLSSKPPVVIIQDQQQQQVSSADGSYFVSAPTTTSNTAAGSSGYMAARPVAAPVIRRAAPGTEDASTFIVLYPRGPLAGLPEDHASRKERFAELDTLQPGWTVELRSREEGSTVEAIFYSPEGHRVGTFAAARRSALQASKQAVAV
jgi:ribosome maturation protein SDO1